MSSSVVASLTVQFGKVQLAMSQVFVLRKNVFACVNLKPAYPGHVLVVSRRPVKRLHELTEVETLDVWTTVQQVSRVIEQIYKSPCQIGVQDGSDAGQTVEHVHFHIIPIPKDQNNEVIMDSDDRPARTIEDMSKEADKYRSYFEQGQFQ